MMDFNTRGHTQGGEDGQDGPLGGCPMALVIEEKRDKTVQDICMNGPRRKTVHITASSTAMVHFVMHNAFHQTQRYHFLLKYEGTCLNSSIDTFTACLF